ncbi:hypothetical protein [Dictyobacter kobayashii]|uniref:Uncharacterized protein n=1 Tax=Dictyobacter kobayashii TaxID=2014872 RepID=A0A402AKI6_9CHLR|nr:hypothetical protein [Dictyobacter kobayashii]GCE19569.1 hypothetical protein KDK_33690 [Dictyobacter kobayashii]
MKKGTRVPSIEYGPGGHREQQRRLAGGIQWVLIAAICATAFICFIGIVSAAQMDSGPGAAANKEQVMQKLIDAGRAHMLSKVGSPNQVPAVQPAPHRQSGIISMRQGPFSSSVFTVRNMWQGLVGSAWTLSYTGAQTNPDGTPGSGGIVLYTETVNAQGGFDLHPQGFFWPRAELHL